MPSEKMERPPQDTERIEKNITPESPEAPVDLRSDNVDQYAETVTGYVEQQAAAITSGAKGQIDSSAENIGLDQGGLEVAKGETNIDASLKDLDEEGQRLAADMKADILEATTDVVLPEKEPNAPASWKEVFSTPAGEVFQKAMSGRAPDGKQDATRSRITNEFTMREFVRNHPKEAAGFAAIYEKEFGKPHDLLVRAKEQIQALEQNPPEIPAEDEKFSDLSYALNQDTEFNRLRTEIDRTHKINVFGTTDFTTIPLIRFMELCNTNENLRFSADREAENQYRQQYVEKARLYDQRETTRVYRDPDGQINIDRDPLYLKAFEADDRGLSKNSEDALRDFARRYPEKAKGYAERYPNIHQLVSAAESATKTREAARFVENSARIEKEVADMVAFRERARRVKEGLLVEMESASSPIGKIEASKTWSSADWLEQQRKMNDEPYLAPDQRTFADIEGAFAEIERQNHSERTFERSPDAPYKSVDTRLIVRAPSLKGWGDSYHEVHRKETSKQGENAVIEIARKISSNVNNVLENSDITDEADRTLSIDAALDSAGVFRDDSFPVYLKGHEGPRGPVFLVQDGSHRVAAAKLAGLDHVRGRVGGLTDEKTAKKVWFESLALMPEKARISLRAIYDQVYPPTPEDKIADDEALEQAKLSVDEIIQERDLNRQTIEQRARKESEQYMKVEEKFNNAKTFADQVRDSKRFNRLRQEAGLQFLKEHALDDSLWREYEQQIDDQGYLIRKDGKDSYITPTGYDVGDSYRQILIATAEAYQREFPKEYSDFLAKKSGS